MKISEKNDIFCASCAFREEYKVVRNLPSALFSFESYGYLESAIELVSDNIIHNLKGLHITYRITPCMISFGIAVNNYRRVNMEFTIAEVGDNFKASLR